MNPPVCETMTFYRLPRGALERLRYALAAAGVQLVGDQGSTPQGPHGVALDYRYDELSQTLTVVCTHKGLLVTCEAIRLYIEKQLSSVRDGDA